MRLVTGSANSITGKLLLWEKWFRQADGKSNAKARTGSVGRYQQVL